MNGCSAEDRPDTASWLQDWEAIIAIVPEQSALGDPPDPALCERTLASLRSEKESLLPAPAVTVDDLVTEWMAMAQAAFFDCPPEGEGVDSFSAAYDELERITDSIETALSNNEEPP